MLANAGADAVYVGLKGASARPVEWDLSLDDICTAAQRAHDAGALLYVAINGQLHEHDVDRVRHSLTFLASVPVDGVIAGDMGVLGLMREQELGIPCHASMLLGVANAGGARALARLGASRIVLPTYVTFSEARHVALTCPEVSFEVLVRGGVCANDCWRCRLPHWHDVEGLHCGCQLRYRARSGAVRREGVLLGRPELDDSTKIDQILGAVSALKIEGRTRPVAVTLQKVIALRQAVSAWREGSG